MSKEPTGCNATKESNSTGGTAITAAATTRSFKDILEQKLAKEFKEWDARAEEAVKVWLQNNSPEHIVNAALEKRGGDIIAKVLGFNNTWTSTGWEVDSCNGRNGESIAGDMIKQQAGQQVVKYFEKLMEGKKFSPNKQVRAALTKEIKDNIEREAKKRIEDHVRYEAEALVKEAVKRVAAELRIKGVVPEDE